MKLKIILFLIFLIPLETQSIESLETNASNRPSCNSSSSEMFLGAKKIRTLEIDVKNYRKWSKNYFKAVTDKNKVYLEDILEKYKKKFSAQVSVNFVNGLSCIFEAVIRINGDHKDHLLSIPPISSLDVELLNGNIDSITKFKLFLPHTKNNDNEIFITAILKSLGFLSPKTFYVSAVFNKQKVIYLFQEKINKEMIEANHYREAPILEGDERFLWREDTDQGFDTFGLSRLINRNWSKLSPETLKISIRSVSLLNRAYLEYLSMKSNVEDINHAFFLNSSTLGNTNKLAIKKNQEFKAFLVALRANHGLRPHNRSFYFDPMYQYFLPIYYDGDSKILNESKEFIPPSLEQDEIIGSPIALNSIKELDKNKLLKLLQDSGMEINRNQLNIIMEKIKFNLNQVSTGLYTSPEQHQYTPYFSAFNESSKLLAFYNTNIKKITSCNFKLSNCKSEIINNENYANLLAGRYKNLNEEEYLFIGSRYSYTSNTTNKALVTPNITREIGADSKLLTFGFLEVSIDTRNNVIDITQIMPNSYAVFVGGTLKEWTINFKGMEEEKEHIKIKDNLFTGCLSFLDMRVEAINIFIENSNCEDGVNLIRTSGDIQKIHTINALSDGIDIDFSDLDINNIYVDNAKNDCIDFSAGNYRVENIVLGNCNDKAISIGEKSQAYFEKVDINNAHIGIAVKDSSSVKIVDAKIRATNICMAAYNKKQEFWGGLINVKQHTCSEKDLYKGLYSNINNEF